ncbi:MAG TPA: hypothetical protein VLW75_00160, partial [Rhizomicrobium sp.]|nr:hypothetical protein [Rhizomicrobium sp.]
MAQSAIDNIDHTFQILQHIQIPKPQHAKVLAVQPCGAAQIMRPLFFFGALTAIDLDDQSRRQTNEVGKI